MSMEAWIELIDGHEPGSPYERELLIRRKNGDDQPAYHWLYIWPYEVALLVQTLQKFMADGGLKDLNTELPKFSQNESEYEDEVPF